LGKINPAFPKIITLQNLSSNFLLRGNLGSGSQNAKKMGREGEVGGGGGDGVERDKSIYFFPVSIRKTFQTGFT
jgi:hypothetical protein